MWVKVGDTEKREKGGPDRGKQTAMAGRGPGIRGSMRPKAGEERRGERSGGRLCLDCFSAFKRMASDDHGNAWGAGGQ